MFHRSTSTVEVTTDRHWARLLDSIHAIAASGTGPVGEVFQVMQFVNDA